MNAWLFQDSRQKKKLGDKAPWSVGWYDPEGRKRSKRIGSKSMAEKFRKKIEGELAAGTYQGQQRKTWCDFRAEFEAKIVSGMQPGTRRETLSSLEHFQRISKPAKLSTIKTAVIDQYIALRRRVKQETTRR